MFDVKTLYSTEKKILLYTGVYPTKNENYQFLSLLSSIFFVSYSYILLFMLFIQICLKINDMEVVANILVFLMTQLAFDLKMANFIRNKDTLMMIEGMLKSPLLEVDEMGSKIINEYMDICRKLAIVFRFLCIFVIIFYTVFPLLDTTSTKVYPLNLWLPFDPDNYYVAIFVYEIGGILISALINSNLDLLCVILISYVTAQIDILKENLMRITTVKNDFKESEDVVYRRLKLCVKQYTFLHRFANEVQSLFGNGVLIQFAATVVVICTTIFQMMVISIKSTQFILLIIYFMTMMCQIVMYCYFGHIIMTSSSEITTACYMGDWLNCTVKVRKMLILVMERAKRPVVITAGTYFVLNLPTLLSILKASYSCLALLQRTQK